MAMCEEEEEPAVLLKTEDQFQKWNDLITRTETCPKHYRLLLANSLALWLLNHFNYLFGLCAGERLVQFYLVGATV